MGNLKAFSHKFLSFLTVRLDPELGLRVPNVLEAQAADRSIWNSISELLNEQNWSMDDALHEFCYSRADMNVLLQPRPKVLKISQPIRTDITDKGGKPGPKGGKSKGKSSKSGGNPKGELDIQHIAGKLNEEADALSRWSGVDAIPFSFQESDRVRISLADLWIPRIDPQKFPSDAFLLWQLPSV